MSPHAERACLGELVAGHVRPAGECGVNEDALPEVKVSALGTDVVVDGCLAEGASLAWNQRATLRARNDGLLHFCGDYCNGDRG